MVVGTRVAVIAENVGSTNTRPVGAQVHLATDRSVVAGAVLRFSGAGCGLADVFGAGVSVVARVGFFMTTPPVTGVESALIPVIAVSAYPRLTGAIVA